jgi:hypothetical protein
VCVCVCVCWVGQLHLFVVDLEHGDLNVDLGSADLIALQPEDLSHDARNDTCHLGDAVATLERWPKHRVRLARALKNVT